MTPVQKNASATARLPVYLILLYALPAIPNSIMHAPAGAILPTVYAKFAGLELAAIGMVIILTRAFDAITDPLIGFLSDRTQSRLGPRKPWVIMGSLLSLLSIYFLFRPSANGGLTYFFIWYFLIFLGWTMIEIPLRAWGVELSHNYNERSRISAYLSIAGGIGTILFMSAVYLPGFGTTDWTPEVLSWVSWIIIASLPITIGLAVIFVPSGKSMETRTEKVGNLFKTVAKNKPFWLFVSVFIFGGMGGGIIASLLLLFMDGYLGIGDKYSIIIISYFVMHLLGTPVWLRLTYILGKHRAWAISWVLSALCLPFFLLLEPGPGSFIPLLSIILFRGFISAADYVVPMAILGDIVDYDTLKSGRNRSGSYFSFLSLVFKLNQAIGGAIGFIILGWIGFKATGGNSQEVVDTFRYMYGIVPTLLYIVACIILWNYPITPKRHDIIRRRIEQRAARELARANTLP